MTEANGTASADLVAALGELAEVRAEHEVNAGPIKYKYADLAQIMTAVRPVLAKHNLVVMQDVETSDTGDVLVFTTLVHASGETFKGGPLAAKMPPNPQQVGSIISYFRRYQLTARLGIAVEDDDGAAASKGKPAGEKNQNPPSPQDPQTKKAMALFDQLKVKDRKQRLAMTSAILGRKIASWGDVPSKERGTVIDDLNRRLSAAEVSSRQADADEQLERDLLSAAGLDPAEDPTDAGPARFDEVDEPRIDSDLDEVHADLPRGRNG